MDQQLDTSRPTVSEVLAKLVTHGSPRQIADYLTQQGVLGIRQSSNMCIIAEYLRQTTGASSVQVAPGCSCCPPGEQGGTVRARGEDGLFEVVALPEPLNELAHRFDRGNYPKLVRP